MIKDHQIPPPINSVYKYTVKDLHGVSYNNNSKKYLAYITSNLNSKSQYSTSKNLGSDHILMPF